jgi:hypothetical protein
VPLLLGSAETGGTGLGDDNVFGTICFGALLNDELHSHGGNDFTNDPANALEGEDGVGRVGFYLVLYITPELDCRSQH